MAEALAYLHGEIERLDRDGIKAIQRRKLAALGDRLAQSPDWVAHFRQAGMSPRDLHDPSALAQVPTLEKAHLRERYPFPMLTVAPTRVARFFATSGTTGLPVLFGFTRHDLDHLLAQQVARQLVCIGLKPGDRAYQGYGYGLWIGGPAFDFGLLSLGATTFPVGPGRAELVVEWMRDQSWIFASVSPLWMMTLIRIAQARGIDPKREWSMRLAALGGQSVSRAFREELEVAMPSGFRAHNTYGTTEAGGPVISTSCPHSHQNDEMHLINEDTVLTEILDPVTLAPVHPGEIGEIVITTLDKQASPVVRWRTHDLVQLSQRPYDCPCGRHGMPLIGRIIGRSDDMLKVRGVIVFPSQIEDVIASTPGTVKDAWQIYVAKQDLSYEAITVAIELQSGSKWSREQLAQTVAYSLSDRLGLKICVEAHAEGTLPRYEAKAQRVIVRSGD
jgi:phenylacetate-CoA ligase